MKNYFGTDGVRGRVGEPPITPDFLVRLGFVAGRVLLKNGTPSVLIGKDTRRSGYMVESALESGFSAAGAEVLLSGPLPSAAVSYMTKTLRLSAGVVISASHNPHYDNGVKFFGPDGNKLPDETETAIERQLQYSDSLSFNGEPGGALRLEDVAGRYIEFCKRAFPARLNLQGMRLLVDCANGAAYHIAPKVFHELGANVTVIGDKPNGLNINVGCGVSEPAAAAAALRECRADVGVVLDGDADRVMMIDEKGDQINGDALLFIIANDMQRRQKSPLGVVGTIMSNGALVHALDRRGIAFHRAEVGDRHVNDFLQKLSWPLGGEPSGHIVLPELHNTGDGIISSLRVLATMRETGKSLSDLTVDYIPYPQVCRNIAVTGKRQVMENDALQDALKEARNDLGEHGRVIVRPSGTEPLIRVMAEGEDELCVRAAAEMIESTLKRIIHA